MIEEENKLPKLLKKVKKPPTPGEAIAEIARKLGSKRKKLVKPSTELAKDLIVLSTELISNLEKYLAKGMAEPARRARILTRAIDFVGRAFRVQSLKEHRNV